MELWTTGVASPRGSARAAKQLEDAGWAGFQVVDGLDVSGAPADGVPDRGPVVVAGR